MTLSVIDSYTNSALKTARECLRKFFLRYVLRLEPDTDEEREALEIGTLWHKMHEARSIGIDPYEIAQRAPSLLWTVKLSRLFAAYEWYWSEQKLTIVEPEHTFRMETPGGNVFEGQIDATMIAEDGQQGIVEYKTTGESIEAGASYWDRLRMDTQTGLYALASKRPAFILYDVVRKPTINPKNIPKKDADRMIREVEKTGACTYYGEEFTQEQLAAALVDGRETPEFYGARLTADIGERASYYFERRPVPRTDQDFDSLIDDVEGTVLLLTVASVEGVWPRNPDVCSTYGLCQFFKLCSNNVCPDGNARPFTPPEGFRVREHLHPELVKPEPQQQS